MSIAILGPLPPPVGGQSVLIEETYNALKNSEFDVEIINISHEITSKFIRVFFTFYLLYRMIKIVLTKRIRLVHIHSSSGLALFEKLFLAIFLKLLNRKVLLHIHGGSFKNDWKYYPVFLRFFLKKSLNILSDGIIVLSETWKEFYLSEIIYSKNIYVLANGVRVNSGNLCADKSNFIDCIFIGDISPNKGVLDLAKALNELDSNIWLRVNMVGSVNKNYQKEITDAFNELHDNISVCFHGILLGEEKWNIFSMCDFLVLPSLSEDLPMSIIEAMALGKAIIATDVGSVSELVHDGENGFLVEPGNLVELSSALEEMCLSHKIRANMSIESLKMAEKYSLSNHVENLKRVYDEFI